MGDWPMAISQSQKREGPLALMVLRLAGYYSTQETGPAPKRARFSD